jgi:transposase
MQDRPFAGKAPPTAPYCFSPDRKAEHRPHTWRVSLASFRPMPMPGKESLCGLARTKPGPITEVACWAHCRRQIFEVWEDKKSPVAKEAIDRIAAVYAIEAKA